MLRDALFLLDIFDRKTGKRYEVFSEPTIKFPGFPEVDEVFPYQDGFKVEYDGLLNYCFINDDDRVTLIPF
jgi:hypothetical protein